MPDERDDSGRSHGSGQTYDRQITPDPEYANYSLLEVIADIESVDVTALPPMWTRIDDALEELFQEPPAPEARMELTFSYHGYRITVRQSGDVSLTPLSDDERPD